MMSKYWFRGGAEYSDCKRFRYLLRREIHPNLLIPQTKDRVLFVMLNPSTATEFEDDPTIRRCVRFAHDWGFANVSICNLFAFRATDPAELVAEVKAHGGAAAAGGVDNDRAIELEATRAELVVVAWGSHMSSGALRETKQDERIVRLLRVAADVMCLDLTKDGAPKHPLYLAADSELRPFSGIMALKPLTSHMEQALLHLMAQGGKTACDDQYCQASPCRGLERRGLVRLEEGAGPGFLYARAILTDAGWDRARELRAAQEASVVRLDDYRRA